MARLRTSSTIVALAMNVRTEGMGVRATGRSFGKSHSTIVRWEERLANPLNQWSPTAPKTADLTVEADEMKSTLAWVRTFPPSECEGWTIHFIERETRYLIAAQAGQKRDELFRQGTAAAWAWASTAQFIRWFSGRAPVYRD
jgi:transposase